MTQEIELKYLISSRADFQKLVVGLHAENVETLTQNNTFFDTQDKALSERKTTVRVRDYGDKKIFTLKGKNASSQSDLSLKEEYETPIDAKTLEALLGENYEIFARFVVDFLKTLTATPLISETIQLVENSELISTGSFVNYRKEFVKSIEGVEALIALDETHFSPDKIDFELEAEVSKKKNVEVVRLYLQKKFKKLEIFYKPAHSKYSRYLNLQL